VTAGWRSSRWAPRLHRVVGRRRRDCGSATVWVLVACLLTWAMAALALSIGGALVARHRAESAADLAALAGARALADGGAEGCADAARVAAATRTLLVACDRLADGSLQVVVEAPLPQLLARMSHLPPARARARAGSMRSVNPDASLETGRGGVG
jgi:secretion/DNA translocation related TadE-like protein